MKLDKVICTFSILLISVTAYAKQGGHDSKPHNPCTELYVDVVNATHSIARLVGDPEYVRMHGYIVRRGKPTIPVGQDTVWDFRENPFAGPTGTIVYTWKSKVGDTKKTKKCTIYYDQSYCLGFLGYSAGYNRTHVKGSCTVYNDPTKPSIHWELHGESQVTLEDDVSAIDDDEG